MKKLICIVLVLIFILCNGCIEKKSDNLEQKKKRDYIVYNLGKLPKDLITLNNHTIAEEDLIMALFEGLVDVDEKGNIVPELAESWEVNKDYTCYKFKIRENVYWSNGDKITSKDFKIFFNNLLNNKNYNVYCCNKYNFDINSIENNILEIKSNYPCSCLLEILTQPVFRLRKLDDNLYNWKSKYKDINYTGAYKINFITNKNEIILIKNNRYWAKNKVKNYKVKITSIEESENVLANFKISNIDLFKDIPLSEKESLSDNKNIEMFNTQIGESINFNLNKEGITKDINFRKAIASSINRSEICYHILKNTAEPALAYVPYDIHDGVNGLFRKKNFYNQYGDVKKAKEFLNKTNYSKSKENIVFAYTKGLNNKRVCEYIKKYLKNNLDIDLELKEYDEDEIIDVIKSGKYDLIKTNYIGEYNYPTSFLDKWCSCSKFNVYGYKNNNYDALIQKSNIETNKFTKKELLQNAEKMLIEDYATIPLYFKNIVVCKKNNIDEVKVNKKGNIDISNVNFKDIN